MDSLFAYILRTDKVHGFLREKGVLVTAQLCMGSFFRNSLIFHARDVERYVERS